MPRGRSRKNTAVEILPPEEDQSPKQKVIEVKHKTEWSELRPVDESSEDAETGELEEIEIEERPRRKTPKNERDELRKKLAQSNVTPASNLKLTIEKYLHSEVMDGAGGMSGDTEHCTKYPCVESHITNEDYLDVARNKWGAGMYRFTLRLQNKIVTAWDKRISGGATGPIIQHVNPADPNSPQVIVQSNGDGQQAYQPPSIRDMMRSQKDALKEHLEMTKLMREAYGLAPEQSQQPRSEDELIASAIIKQPAVIESVVESIIKRVGGKGGGESEEPWYAEAVKDAVKSGQAAQIVKTAIDALFGGFKGLFPGGQNNGQAAMGSQRQQVNNNAGGSVENIQGQNHQATSDQGNSAPLGLSQGSEPATNQRGTDNGARSHDSQQSAIPEDQAFSLLIDHCRRNVPVKIAFDRLMLYADAVNEQYPQGSIDGYIDLLGSMSTDDVIDFVAKLPGGEQITSLPHAKEWTADLQRLIKESEGGDES